MTTHLTDDEVIEIEARRAADTIYRHSKSFLDGFQGSQMLENIRQDLARERHGHNPIYAELQRRLITSENTIERLFREAEAQRTVIAELREEIRALKSERR